MTPTEYEQALATYYRAMGYDVRETQVSGDYGIDLFATLGSSKIGIQAKMYGGGRKVNREMIMQLHGARCYFDCTSATLATDGQVMKDAQQVAAKLNIEMLHFCPQTRLATPIPVHTDIKTADQQSQDQSEHAAISHDIKAQIDHLWQTYVIPLQGQTLTRNNGQTNAITKVDWTGVTRISSRDETDKIPFEIFRLAMTQILTQGSITRAQINDQYSKRASSGIFLVLAQIPLFEATSNPLTLKLRK